MFFGTSCVQFESFRTINWTNCMYNSMILIMSIFIKNIYILQSYDQNKSCGPPRRACPNICWQPSCVVLFLVYHDNSAICFPISLEFCEKHQETIIFRLFVILLVYAKESRASKSLGPSLKESKASKSLGPQNPTKKLAHWVDWVNCYLEIMFSIFSTLLSPPPLLDFNHI